MTDIPYYITDIPIPPEGPGDFYATSVTRADVVAIRTFLQARCNEIYDQYGKDSPEGRMVQAFYEAVRHRMDELDDTFLRLSPATLDQRLDVWNNLMLTLEAWRGTPGHDGRRWFMINHTQP